MDTRTGLTSGPDDASMPQMSDDAFRRVVEYAPSAMVLVDGRGMIVLVNQQAERLFGYPRSSLVGRSIDLLVPSAARAHHAAFRHSFLSSPSPRPMGAGRDLFACRADGSEFPVEIGLNPMDTGRGILVLASIVDITERRRAQQVLEQALQEKTVLLNEVHHRVKNNLQVITSLLNLQANNADDPRVRDILNESQNRVRAMALTHQLLYEGKDFSRVDLGDYINRLSQLLRGTYRSGSDRVELRLDRPASPVYLDLERAVPCGLLVNELVTNAFKHAFPEPRHGDITVAVSSCDGQVTLVVRDNGVGLPPDFDLATVKSLGLQLVPLLVDQLHGALQIEPDSGAHYRITFPSAPTSRGMS